MFGYAGMLMLAPKSLPCFFIKIIAGVCLYQIEAKEDKNALISLNPYQIISLHLQFLARGACRVRLGFLHQFASGAMS